MSRIRAHDVVPYLKTGTIVVGVNFRSVLLVTEDHELVNMHNGRKAEYHEWYKMKEEVEIFENFEDWQQADSPMEIEKDQDDLIKETPGLMDCQCGRVDCTKDPYCQASDND